MPSARVRFARATAGGAFAVCLALFLIQFDSRGVASAAPAGELRALWVLRTSLTSPESIATLVRSARSHGFNTLFVQVRSRGDAYYDSALEPRPPELARQPASFDPLATVIEHGRAAGLHVHAWVNLNLVSSAVYLPKAPAHVIHRHPAWLMVPRELASDLSRIDPSSPRYVAALAAWTRREADDVEGLYMSPATPAAADHVVQVVRDIARRYAVDGIHFDYARYPSDRFDYSRGALDEFRRVLTPTLSPSARHAAARHADGVALADAFAAEFRQFRIARMTALVERASRAVKAERPSAIVSAAAAADIQEALGHRLQDWTAWLERGVIDAVAPMAYTTEPTRFAEQIAAARAAAGSRGVWAGIGAYRLSPSQTIDNIATARRLGAGGVILFSYDSLIDPRQASRDYLAAVGRAW